MTKIALTAAAILIATGSAFAGSDHYGSDGVNQPAEPVGNAAVGNVDNTLTGSIGNVLPTEHNAVNTNATTESGTAQSVVRQSGRGNWGR
ncbi:MAG: DUF680 domain-containing protein [Mesorhizobium sp.]|uniref:DUF680 domain-containing protein n=1 Tax=Mesorhizobium sp. TaxID=1871066 RepID=UPI000FE4E3E0|nr:DUF680 domain-containing protein [Mesorhizobium sp.]RWH84211.1 MAG: DUF680 domain-containing protein [Mesorhizobium sp.]RWH86598.1 MAG: DUF680 domain-containing protein [Mesorhizobium sp.]RWH93882.1 MAG: DUF680 domain-containing protein [Mesorhizobium sp.]RWI02680.1 MAG: DUF680 domain-containing protein [Mesorhizobium sp.]RWI05174.1 MAG: DUF680 domain-containing protein [Mesorhizobium sp.]